jgi:hypothetical protein
VLCKFLDLEKYKEGKDSLHKYEIEPFEPRAAR